MKKGIDISTWQENVDYNKLKEQGIEFAIIRTGYGKNKSQKDKMFEKHYEGLKNANIKIGAYHYSYITSIEGAIQEAKNCLEFIKGKTFDLPIHMEGTAFQQQVWTALCDIPYGETRSYKQIAESIGNPKAVRAVGMANNRNPLLIVVPCHRVIGTDGKLVGYGAGIEKKEFLLRLEKSLL